MMDDWFLRKEPDQLVKKIEGFRDQYTIWSINPVMQAWVRNYILYYSAVLDPDSWDTALSFRGEQGELVKMVVPLARTLTRNLTTLITKQPSVFQAIALTQGSDVMKEVRLGNALAANIVTEHDWDRRMEQMVEMGFVLGSSFLRTVWRTDKGTAYASNLNGIVYDGDIEIKVHDVFDCVYDYSIDDWDVVPWVECRTIKNRWDLIAMYPEMEQEIKSLHTIMDWRGPIYTTEARARLLDDNVYVYETYVRPCPALPLGRMVMYSDHRTIYYDGENKYGTIPITQFKPENVFNMGFGYPIFSNFLGLQEMLDHSISAWATNQAAFAVQNVTIPRDSGISVQQISGMNFLSYTPQNVPGGGKPEGLQLSSTSPETIKLIDYCERFLTDLSNIGPALRGQPPAGVTSGAAIATLTTNALEFISSGTKAYVNSAQTGMRMCINAFRRFASTKRIVRVSGRSGMQQALEFVGKDLDPIQNVKLTMINPLMQTIAGRSDLAEKMVASGLVKTPQDYISILDGAPLSQLVETELSENDLIQDENQEMMKGKPVIALATDQHAMHIRKHSGLLNDIMVRRDNSSVEIILRHIEEHNRLAKETDPMLMAMISTGQMPQLPPQQPADESMPLGGDLPMPNEMTPNEMTSGPLPNSAQPADDLLGR